MPETRSLVQSELARAVEIRRDLHRHPELMFQERRTASLVAAELDALSVQHRTGLAGGTGVLGWLPATEDPGSAPTVALRADMDALPITESTGRPYASANPGVMHACGHDGHTAILLGAARVLARLPRRPNNVLLLFQPAEEGGAGAEKMCADGCLSGTILGRPADLVYGLHGWPDLPIGSLATRTGPLLAATDEFTITVNGKGCHAAYPHLGIDPIVVCAHIICALQTIPSRRTNPLDPIVVTVGAIHAGQANNVIPGSAVMSGTVRTLRPETRSAAEEQLRAAVSGVAQAMGAEAHTHWDVGYPATVNDPAATERFRRIARAVAGHDRVAERENPTMGGEDFSFYGRHARACFFFLGLKPHDGNCPNLHTPEFDFNDDALPLGIETMARLAAEPAETDGTAP